jgi:hypothetical protein
LILPLKSTLVSNRVHDATYTTTDVILIQVGAATALLASLLGSSPGASQLLLPPETLVTSWGITGVLVTVTSDIPG